MKANAYISGILVVLAVSALPAFSAVVYVSASATGLSNGTSWADAYTSLQTAMAGTVAAGEFWIAKGTYKPHSASESFTTTALDSLYGGFAGNETALNERDWVKNRTILSGDLNSNNTADGGDCNLIVQHTVDNRVVLDGLVFEYTSGAGDAGGLRQRYGCATVVNCIFHDLRGINGGAIYTRHGNTEKYSFFTNCLFYNNQATSGGGAMGLYNRGTVDIVNCTFYNNVGASGDCMHIFGGIDSEGAFIRNCIIWKPGAGTVFAGEGASVEPWGIYVSCSDVIGGFAGAGNINTDPLFYDVAATNFSLAEGSPCIDTGTDNNAPTNDILRALRPQGPGYDMGAYEGILITRPPDGCVITVRQSE